jgi:polyphosphate kinase
MHKIINRELSWLNFNERVLVEGLNVENPLLERLRFIAIFSSNMDEFFMVRVSGLYEQLAAGYNVPDDSGLTPTMQLDEITKKTNRLTAFQQEIFASVKNALADVKIFFPEFSLDEFDDTLEAIFLDEVMPVISPVTIDPSHPFPFVYSRRMCMIVESVRDGKDTVSLIMLPETLRRVFRVRKGHSINIFLVEDIIAKYMPTLLKGYEVKNIGFFRVTRDAEMDITSDDSSDLLRAVEDLLSERKRGDVNRIEVRKGITDTALEFLKNNVEFGSSNVQIVDGPLDLTFLFSLCDLKEELTFPPLVQRRLNRLTDGKDIFELIKERPVYFFRPYNPFSVVTDFISQAAKDENVLAIKMTLYRTNKNSKIITSLLYAARNGKQVSVVVELKARFDEERNIGWAKELEEAGCIVTYGIVGLKIHAKCTLIVRKEGEKIVRYTHVATGNYNEITANTYSDIDLITADEDFGRDATQLFNYLMGFTEETHWRVMKIAPFSLRQAVLDMIDSEIAFAKKKKKAEISIKVNSLIDKEIINKLYEASANGVKVRLIVRGICGLRPQVKRLSENITVISIIGRFLEHARVLYFYHEGKERYFITSADLMPRNLNGRVELMVEITDSEFKASLKHFMNISLKDNAWELVDDNYYKILPKAGSNAMKSQIYFLENEI